MNTQHQTKPSVHTCRRCGWPFPNPHPSAKHRRAHKRICGTIEGYANLILDSDAVSDSDSDDQKTPISDDGHHSHSDDQETPSPTTEKRVIKESGSNVDGLEEQSNRSEDDSKTEFSDAKTEFSDAGISPRVVSEVKSAVQIKFPDSDTKDSAPLVEDRDESHKDKVMSEVSGDKDQGEDVNVLSVASDIPLVDKAETLIEDFKDHKTVYSKVSREGKHVENRSVVDDFEFNAVQENVYKSQTSESADNASEVEGSSDKQPVITLGQRMAAEMKEAEVGHSAVSDSKDSVKVGPVDEGSGKSLTAVDASFDSSSRNSLEGNWGSVSEISDVHGKSEISDDRSRLGRSDTLVESEQETAEQSASEIKEVKVRKSQPSKSEAIAKVTNWSTSDHIANTPLRKLIGEAKSSNPKPSSSMTQKNVDAGKATESGKSPLTRESKNVNQESSSVENSGEGGKEKKKTKGVPSWVRFLCFMPIKR